MEPPAPLPWLHRAATSGPCRRMPCRVGPRRLGPRRLGPRRLGAWLVVASGLLAGCAGDGGTIEETDAVAGAGGGATIPEGYPEGPYGADVGETIPNLAWRGFVEDDGAGLATDTPYVDTSLDDARRSGARWALLHFGAVF